VPTRDPQIEMAVAMRSGACDHQTNPTDKGHPTRVACDQTNPSDKGQPSQVSCTKPTRATKAGQPE
jgi:hypothetical protein